MPEKEKQKGPAVRFYIKNLTNTVLKKTKTKNFLKFTKIELKQH